jgi:hypothetical protein
VDSSIHVLQTSCVLDACTNLGSQGSTKYIHENKMVVDQCILQFLRHVIPADNSCLFSSVGLVMQEGTEGIAQELRQLIAGVVMSNPECKYTMMQSRTNWASQIREREREREPFACA